MTTYSKNDILSLQLKYKADHDILDLISTVDDLQEDWESIDKMRDRLNDIEGDLDDKRDEINKLESKLEDAETLIEKLEKQLEQKETPHD